MKYVIFEIKGATTFVYPIIFPESITHKTIGDRVGHAISREFNQIATVRSAGFCRVYACGFKATPGSESLRIEDVGQGDDDTAILNMPNAMQGMWTESENVQVARKA